ncbi:MAG: histidine-type phosphatase [Bacteroidales bacterium]|nr:histidine-type phosphatase [Candidatus Physcousia equi]
MAHYSPELISCVYRAYPGVHIDTLTSCPVEPTEVPAGFKPVFLSHYGRHGSRFLLEDSNYTNLVRDFQSQQLTADGRELLRRLRIAAQQAVGRGGDLTPLGEEQHRGIAERMYERYPALFKDDASLMAYASTSRRCMMSMMAFCERLKELNPDMLIRREVAQRHMAFICADTPKQRSLMLEDTQARRAYRDFAKKNRKTEDFCARYFAHPQNVKEPHVVMEQLYFLAQDMQDCGRPTELLSFFTSDELYAIWRVKNAQIYLSNGDSPLSKGYPAEASDSLLKHIIHDADDALQSQRVGATLRFGHDTCLMRLLARMKVKECCPACSDMERLEEQWQDFNVTPMAANLQLVFYQNKHGRVLVHVLLNEREVHFDFPSQYAPYYDWEQLKSYWQ